jgi:GrpB-like predicted nucleotidyltransferase (UPF0157 family)
MPAAADVDVDHQQFLMLLGQRVEVVPYRAAWADEGALLAARLRELLPGAVGVQHIGSTAVPGLAAKDRMDMMVQVHGPRTEPFRSRRRRERV